MSRLSVELSKELAVYESEIFRLADEYIENYLGGDYEKAPESFMGIVYHISDQLPEIPNDNIDLMDAFFDSYAKLCAKLNVLPTLEVFSILVKTHRTTFSDWNAGTYRYSDVRYANSVKRWKEVCKSHLVNRLANTNKTSVNLIFLGKSCYNMVEAKTEDTEKLPEKRAKTLDELPDFRQFTKYNNE